MIAYPSANGGEGIVLLDQFQRFPVFACRNEVNVTLNADMGGTGSLTGGSPDLVNGKGARYGLGELPVDRFPGIKIFIEFGG